MFSQTLSQAPRPAPVISRKSSWDRRYRTVNQSWHPEDQCANPLVPDGGDQLSTISPTPSRGGDYDFSSCPGKTGEWYQLFHDGSRQHQHRRAGIHHAADDLTALGVKGTAVQLTAPLPTIRRSAAPVVQEPGSA
jgi:hypothetical protein